MTPAWDLAANSHVSAKSRCTNFSSSTGNSTNRSINTKQYAITHKSRALALATEIRKTAQLEHENREMVCRLQELKILCASGPNQRSAPSPVYSSPNEHLKSPPEPPTEEPPQPFDDGPEAMHGGYKDNIAYDPILSDFQTQENARHAGTMLKSCLDHLLSEREVSAVKFIMSAIDPTTSSQIKKAQSNLPAL